MDYRLVALYDATELESVAEVLLDVMDSCDGLQGEEELRHNRYIAYRTLMHTWKNQNKNLSALNEADLAVLENFTEGTDLTAVRAFALCYHNGIVEEKNRELYLPEKNRRPENGTLEAIVSHGSLRVFPNPAEDHVTVDYRIDRAFEKAEFQIIDAKGVVVMRHNLKHEINQIVLPLNLTPSSYRCTIQIDGQSYLSHQLVIR